MVRRVEQMDQTRQRIVDAAVAMHGSVGPARTTIAGIADRAGVTRLTVYRHFPDEEALFNACSSHWYSQQRLPDPGTWLQEPDPTVRLRTGLTDLYRFYRAGEPMLTRVHRDWDALPEGRRKELRDQNEHFRHLLTERFGPDPSGLLRAAVGHAVSFGAWRSLCLENGLSNPQAVTLMTALAAAAADGRDDREGDDREG